MGSYQDHSSASPSGPRLGMEDVERLRPRLDQLRLELSQACGEGLPLEGGDKLLQQDEPAPVRPVVVILGAPVVYLPWTANSIESENENGKKDCLVGPPLRP